MPHHKSAAKRVKTNEKARLSNVAVKSRMRSAVKAVRSATKQGRGRDRAEGGHLDPRPHRRQGRHQEGDCQPAEVTPGPVRGQAAGLTPMP